MITWFFIVVGAIAGAVCGKFVAGIPGAIFTGFAGGFCGMVLGNYVQSQLEWSRAARRRSADQEVR